MFKDFSLKSKVLSKVPLAPLTTLKVGGRAEYAIEIKSSVELLEAVRYAHEKKIPTTILGGGSNVLIADQGVPGLTLINRAQSWQIIGDGPAAHVPQVSARWKGAGEDLADYNEANFPTVMVRADSGCLLSRMMAEGLERGVTGLEWFAGIPGSVGGALYMNMHGGEQLFGDRVVTARIFSAGNVKEVSHDYFKFGYDWSVLHDTHEIILDVDLALRRGPVDKARQLMAAWMRRKNKTQEKKSTGCIFQNLSSEDQFRLNIPTPSAGYVIDRLLDLKGKQIGGAKVSEQHGNFMINAGNARAEDFAMLIAYIKEQARNKLQLTLREEVMYLGF